MASAWQARSPPEPPGHACWNRRYSIWVGSVQFRMWRSCVLLVAAAAVPLGAQPTTRAEEIQQAREEKAQSLKPEEVTRTENFLLNLKDKKILERITAGVWGFRLKLGGLATGSGFALGPEYYRPDLLDGKLTFRSSAAVSFRTFQHYDMQASAPNLAGGRLFADVLAQHRNYPSLQYYGPGPDSAKTGRSNFRLEDTSVDFTAGVRPFRRLSAGLTGGYVMVNTGRGRDRRFASIEETYSEPATPGLVTQSDFLRGGGFLQFDYRDNPGGPRRGGNYVARYLYYSDRDAKQFSFRRFEADLQQYFPFFNERRVIVLRGNTEISDTNHGQRVPFYLQPVLGGSESLRGYRAFRFYDDNLLNFTAEYRWESFSGLDMAIFADAGKVFGDLGQFNLRDLESSVGFGFRFNVRNAVFLRIDVGFSHEGYQLWFKFNNVF
ncbi:MAG: BamA/TamA family outer membrane protein [Bryobacterales bacterium]|nr:BamA/TamA family outer membrane protein [Bryobacterales bacterium]